MRLALIEPRANYKVEVKSESEIEQLMDLRNRPSVTSCCASSQISFKRCQVTSWIQQYRYFSGSESVLGANIFWTNIKFYECSHIERYADRYRGSVRLQWLEDWHSCWPWSLFHVDRSCSDLDVQTSLSGSTNVVCRDTTTSADSCPLHTASPCTRSLIQQLHVVATKMHAKTDECQEASGLVHVSIRKKN